MIGILLIPFIVAIVSSIVVAYLNKIIGGKQSSFFKERTFESKGWNKFYASKAEIFLITMLSSLFVFLYFLFQILVMMGYILPDREPPINLLLMLIVFSYFMLFFTSALPLFVEISKLLVLNLYNWKEFFDIYFGRYDHQLKTLNKLVKTKGKCIAISPKVQFEDPDADQQFLMTYGNNEEIEVIRLKENEPFLKSRYIVKEGEKIEIIGDVRRIYDKEREPDQYKVLFAYHVKSVK